MRELPLLAGALGRSRLIDVLGRSRLVDALGRIRLVGALGRSRSSVKPVWFLLQYLWKTSILSVISLCFYGDKVCSVM